MSSRDVPDVEVGNVTVEDSKEVPHDMPIEAVPVKEMCSVWPLAGVPESPEDIDVIAADCPVISTSS